MPKIQVNGELEYAVLIFKILIIFVIQIYIFTKTCIHVFLTRNFIQLCNLIISSNTKFIIKLNDQITLKGVNNTLFTTVPQWCIKKRKYKPSYVIRMKHYSSSYKVKAFYERNKLILLAFVFIWRIFMFTSWLFPFFLRHFLFKEGISPDKVFQKCFLMSRKSFVSNIWNDARGLLKGTQQITRGTRDTAWNDLIEPTIVLFFREFEFSWRRTYINYDFFFFKSKTFLFKTK